MKLKSENAVQRKIVCLNKRLTLRIEGDTPTKRLRPRIQDDTKKASLCIYHASLVIRSPTLRLPLQFRFLTPHSPRCFGELRLARRQDATRRAYSTTP